MLNDYNARETFLSLSLIQIERSFWIHERFALAS